MDPSPIGFSRYRGHHLPFVDASASATRPHTHRRQLDVSRPGPTSRAAYVPIGDGRSPASLSPFPFHRTRHGYGTVTLHVPRRPEASFRRTRR